MENRDEHNYYGETILIPNKLGSMDEIYETITNINIGDRFRVIFEGFDSIEHFRNRIEPNPRYRREFNPLIADLQDYAEKIDAIKKSALGVLGVAVTKWELKTLSVDVANLQIYLSAEHKTFAQTTTRSISTPAEFEQFKTDNPAFLELYAGFWTYAKTRDSFLRNLKPYAA